jgi:hypothetical protein
MDGAESLAVAGDLARQSWDGGTISIGSGAAAQKSTVFT